MDGRKHFVHGLTSGGLAAVTGIIYMNIYEKALDTHFDKIINPLSVAASCIIGCMLMALGYALLSKFKKPNLKGTLNILIAILSFSSIIGPISMSLPLTISTPELFPGLAVPMHFFPALAFFTVAPFFRQD